MLHIPPPSAARIPLAPVPGQRALAGKRMRAVTATAPTPQQFLQLVEDHLKRTGTPLTRFGREAVGDGNFVFDLRGGRSPSLNNVNRILRAMAAAEPDFELLALAHPFERAWAAERALYREQAAAPEAEQDRFEPLLDAAALKTNGIADQIASLRAVTLEGLKLKARAFAKCWDGDPFGSELLEPQETTDRRLVASILRDLAANDGDRPISVGGAETPSTAAKAA